MRTAPGGATDGARPAARSFAETAEKLTTGLAQATSGHEVWATLCMVTYALLLIPIMPLTLLGVLLALVVPMLRPEGDESLAWLRSHDKWQWRTAVVWLALTFGGGAIGAAVGMIIPPLGAALAGLCALSAIVWSLVRSLKGIRTLSARAPVPKPNGVLQGADRNRNRKLRAARLQRESDGAAALERAPATARTIAKWPHMRTIDTPGGVGALPTVGYAP